MIHYIREKTSKYVSLTNIYDSISPHKRTVGYRCVLSCDSSRTWSLQTGNHTPCKRASSPRLCNVSSCEGRDSFYHRTVFHTYHKSSWSGWSGSFPRVLKVQPFVCKLSSTLCRGRVYKLNGHTVRGNSVLRCLGRLWCTHDTWNSEELCDFQYVLWSLDTVKILFHTLDKVFPSVGLVQNIFLSGRWRR